MKIDINKIPKTVLLWGILLALVFVILFLIKSCNAERHYANSLAKIANYKDTVKTYKSKSGKLIEYNLALKVDLKSLSAIKDSLYNYINSIDIPEPDVIIQTKTVTKIDSIPVIKFVTINGKFDTTFYIKEKYYSIAGNVNNKRLALDSINIPNKSTVVVGERETKWWKKNEYIITIDNSNPYVHNTGMQSYTLEERESKWSIGPSLGYGIYMDPFKGNTGHGVLLGIGVSYNFINF